MRILPGPYRDGRITDRPARLSDVMLPELIGDNVHVPCADGLAPTGTRAAKLHSTPRATMQKALDRLVAAEQHVIARQERPAIVDPLFAIWLARRGRTGVAR